MTSWWRELRPQRRAPGGRRSRKATGALAEYYAAPPVRLDQPVAGAPLLAVDVETTGLNPKKDVILAIGWVPINGSRISPAGAGYAVIRHDPATIEALPGGLASAKIHGITHADIAAGEPLDEVLARLLRALAGRAMVVHFAPIETEFLDRACRGLFGAGLDVPVVDTFAIERRYFERMATYPRGEDLRLARVRARYGLPHYRSHNALTDALACGELLLAMLNHERNNLSMTSTLSDIIGRSAR